MMTRFRRIGCALACFGLLSGCGVYDGIFGDDEKLEGERIRIRDARGQGTAAFSGAAPALPGVVSNRDWTQTNAQSSHASGNLNGPRSLTLAWRADGGSSGNEDGAITDAPIIAGGRVYALDGASQVSAFDAGSGSVAWRSDLTPDGEDSEDGFGGGLATDGDLIFATTGFGEVVALSAASGEISWRYSAGAPFRSAPALQQGRVLAVTRDNRAVALSARTGELIWRLDGITSDAGSLGGASPAISGQLAVLPFASGEVIGVDVTSGRRIWSAVLGGARRGLARSSISDVTGDPVIAGRAVVAANQSGRIVAIDGQSGQRGWTRTIGAIGPLWAAGRSIFLVSDDAKLVRLTLGGGQTIWSTDLPAYEDEEDREDPISYSGPVLVNGQLLVTESTGQLLVFDAATGQQSAVIELSDGTNSGVAVAGGTVYVLSRDGTLQAYR